MTSQCRMSSISSTWGILLRPLPVAEPERLVRIVNIAYIGELVELRTRARTLDVAACPRPSTKRSPASTSRYG